MLGLPRWRLISFGENKKPLPSILNCWLQVLPVATLEVALAASGPDVMKLLRPDRLKLKDLTEDIFHLMRFLTHFDSATELMAMESMQNLRQ